MADEFIWVLRFDVVRTECLVRKILKITGDNDIRPANDGRRQDVAIIRGREDEAMRSMAHIP
jgi:hypothetical protein